MGHAILHKLSQTLVQRGFDRLLSRIPALSMQRLRALRQWLKVLDAKLTLARQTTQDRLAAPQTGSPLAAPPPGLVDWNRADLMKTPHADACVVRPAREVNLSPDITLYHDDPASELLVKQFRNAGRNHQAPYALSMEVFTFTGTYLSLKIACPFSKDLTHNHIVSLRAFIETDQPSQVHARLSLAKGAHTETIIRDVPTGDPLATAQFDLNFVETRLDGSQDVWIDLSVSNIALNAFTIRDLVLIQSRRAEA